jgi:hypothetical protein
VVDVSTASSELSTILFVCFCLGYALVLQLPRSGRPHDQKGVGEDVQIKGQFQIIKEGLNEKDE